MKKSMITCLFIAASTFSVSAFSATGEYWEITSKMEMEGMPFAMPGTTTKVCVAKGAEKDPRQSAPNKDCEMSDVKTTGNKSSWKVRCNHDGGITEGTGELTYSKDSYQGKMLMKSTSHGELMTMNMALSGKRIGGSCEPGEEVKAMQKQACDTTGYTAKEWIGNADRFLNDSSPCTGKKNELCKAVSKDAPKDTDIYLLLMQMDQIRGGTIAKSCRLNMASITHSICGTMNEDNFDKLSQSCPAEAKKIMEARREKSQEGREFSGRSYSDSSGGQAASGSGSESGSGSGSASNSGSNSGSGTNNPAGKLLDSAKKLKGLFGF